ncbi:hypothetical protein [Archaeoglobus veneficus]|uniref:Uncharacterized protein n=1 Tax=Archaeoglobus veneficus (strain DSM 11195 / SNP6) TaxID=693661 RepID=F2KRJ4_ARCVS|nr:hypothetical protein [Archaeoglobus veneficus]AEA46759.1 hypothetical protein Arcve_0741 [Archaeoglobus veneficus SNP6]
MKTKMLILLMVVLVAGLFAGCTTTEEVATPTTKVTQEETPTATPVEETPAPTPTPEKTPQPSAPAAAAATIDCSVCHKKASDYAAHKDGNGCLKCHGTDPHKIHVGEGTINLECSVCHGTSDKISIPEAPDGQPSCVLCHDSKDPVKPFKDYVNVHIPRGKPCTVCHTQPIDELHKAADAGAQ